MTQMHVQDGSFVSQSAHQDTPRVHEVLHQAQSLLQQLRAARQVTEQRMTETGRVDPIKTVTGRSSLDQAIDRTEQLINEMHAMRPDDEPRHASEPPIVIDSSICHELLQGSNGAANGHRNGRHDRNVSARGAHQHVTAALMK